MPLAQSLRSAAHGDFSLQHGPCRGLVGARGQSPQRAHPPAASPDAGATEIARSRIGVRYPIATIKLLTSIKAVTGIQRIRSHRLFDIAFIRMPSTP